ncbi:hypothetical protein H311_04065 [Anncaliia algerae PRA109]|nr:hypothetical protein H311_04065 [Anncaliia algerae PRA109]
MLFLFLVAYCDIPLGTPIHIVPEFNGTFQIAYDEGVVRLKPEDEGAPGFVEDRVVVMRLYEGKYEITMQGFDLCHCPEKNEIVGCTEREASNLKSLYDIVTSEKGYSIKQDNKCWVKGEYDKMFKGYLIRLELCNNSNDQIWKFEDVELNNEEEDQARLALESSKKRLAYFTRHKISRKTVRPKVTTPMYYGFGTFRHTTDSTKLSDGK